MTTHALVSLHVGHHALTLASAATALAFVIVAVVTAVVLDRRAVPSAPRQPTSTQEYRT